MTCQRLTMTTSKVLSSVKGLSEAKVEKVPVWSFAVDAA